MPKAIMDLWVTSSSEDEEEEEIPPPPPKKSKQRTSEPPKSITKTTKVKPSKRVTRRNDIEEDDEEEGKFPGTQRTEFAGLFRIRRFQDDRVDFNGKFLENSWYPQTDPRERSRQTDPMGKNFP